MKDVRIKILESSSQLFERYGYVKTTLTDVAKAIGKVKTALYYYYKSKEELFAAIVEMEADKFYTSLKEELDKKTNPLEKLKIYVKVRSKLMLEVSDRYKHLKSELLQVHPMIEKNREKYHKMEIELIKSILEEGKKQKIFEVDAPATAASLLVNALKGMEIQLYVKNNFGQDGTEISNVLNLLLFGIVRKK